MTYIELINKVWQIHEEESFSTTELALTFYLLKVNNACSWKDSFRRNNSKITADLGISFNTLKNARNRLQQRGVIRFQSQNGSPNVEYWVASTLSNFDEVTTEVLPRLVTRLLRGSDEVLPTKDRQDKTRIDLTQETAQEQEVIDQNFFRLAGQKIPGLAIDFLRQHYAPTLDAFFINQGRGIDREVIIEAHRTEYPMGFEFKNEGHLLNSVKFVITKLQDPRNKKPQTSRSSSRTENNRF